MGGGQEGKPPKEKWGRECHLRLKIFSVKNWRSLHSPRGRQRLRVLCSVSRDEGSPATLLTLGHFLPCVGKSAAGRGRQRSAYVG